MQFAKHGRFATIVASSRWQVHFSVSSSPSRRTTCRNGAHVHTHGIISTRARTP
jgi:hypothetical protein